VAGLFLAQGYMQLFCGYVENYAPYTLALGLFLWLGLRFVDCRAPFFAPALAALLAFGLHLSGAVLFPALVFLWVAGLRRPARRRSVLRDTAMALVAGVLLVVALARLGGGYRLGESFLQVFRAAVVGGGADASYLWSLRHVRDFLNEQLLIGPLGFLLFVPALVVAWRSGAWRHPTTGFLLVCGLAYLGASWVAGDSNLGYARNWDLLAPGGLVQAAAGLGILAGVVSGPVLRPAALAVALGVSLYHTSPWIALNASTERGLQRMAGLPLGEGRAPTAVGNWYLRRGDDRRAREWFEKALGEYPRNVNALELLGLIHSRGGRMQEAAAAFERASALRPDKPDYRHNLAEALFQLGRYAEALPHDERLCRERPESFRAWERRYRSLAALGRSEEARRVAAEALGVFAEKQRRTPQDYAANFELGLVQEALGRPDEALGSFERALGAEPGSVPALYNVSLMLWQLGRGPESRPHLERLLRLDPEPALRDQAQAWLRELGG
jgi:tetratricopeptide (TPR) repeat protein